MIECEWCGARDVLDGRCVRCGTQFGKQPEGRGSGDYTIKLLGLIQPDLPQTGYEDQYLVEYDPLRQGWSKDGLPMRAHIVTSNDVQDALRFESVVAARAEWMRWDGTRRIDGKPSRPLTAFNIELKREEQE